MAENLEPRLVLSALVLGGNVDPPRSTPPESEPQDKDSFLVSARSTEQSQDLHRQFQINDANSVPVDEVPVLSPIDPPGTGSVDAGTTPGGGRD